MSGDIPIKRMSLTDALDLAAIIADPEEGSVEELVESGPEVIDVLRCEVERLRAIIEGRTVPPTDEEIEVHEAAGGRWRCVATVDGQRAPGLCFDGARDIVGRESVFDGLPRRIGSVYVETWWALDCHGMPCPWPVVGGAP